MTNTECPQCGETACNCTPLCLSRVVATDIDWGSRELICELAPDHEGRHQDGTFTWSDDDDA